ncbi:1,2-dihydroxy-3-keto-5-methylthiopentene dioxygenase 2 [Meredithblackwellia eburnea MCA 4105]
MKAWIYDDIPGDQRLPHEAGEVSLDKLAALGLLTKDHVGMDVVEQVVKDRDYKNRDTIKVSREGLGELYDEKIKGFFREHMHEDEEIRYILEGEGYFDVRDATDAKWIRVYMTEGDLLVLPAGIYHRFTLTSKDYVQALRLFKDEPKWIPYDRSAETDINPYRKDYIDIRGAGITV